VCAAYRGRCAYVVICFPRVLAACRLNAGILAVGLVIYALVARTYTEKPVTSVDKVWHSLKQAMLLQYASQDFEVGGGFLQGECTRRLCLEDLQVAVEHVSRLLLNSVCCCLLLYHLQHGALSDVTRLVLCSDCCCCC
jgi:hypothetical protein